MKKHELVQLEISIKELRSALTRVADGAGFEEFIKIVHRPGFTTPAEAALLQGVANSMLEQARTLMSLKQILLTGAEKVELNPQPLPP